LHLMLFNIT